MPDPTDEHRGWHEVRSEAHLDEEKVAGHKQRMQADQTDPTGEALLGHAVDEHDETGQCQATVGTES